MKKRQTPLRAIWRFATDDDGAEVTELAIVLALIVAGSILTIILLGGKVGSQYATFNGQLP